MILLSVITSVGKFIYGSIVGAMIWHVIVYPYLRYYDFTFGTYWLLSAFALTVGLIFLSSRGFRCLMLLYIPNMASGATQNYVIMLVFTAILLNPVTNIGLNAIESVRVIGCSLTMTFDQLRERARLVLNPIAEVLSDKNQTALDPIRNNLFEIQQFVGKLQQNINSAVAETTELTRKETGKDASGGGRVSWSPEVPLGSGEARESTPVEWSWDFENLGVKATVDIDRLRSLARQSKLQQYLIKGNETLATQRINITDVLYNSCLSMFRSAKNQCGEAVDGMHSRCKAKYGPLLASYWCEPVTKSLEYFCPTIMNTFVNETNICTELRGYQIKNIREGLKFVEVPVPGSNKKRKISDVNEAFHELTQQIAQLNKGILTMDDTNDQRQGDGETSNGLEPSDRLRRFELSLTFNERTRQIFQDIKQLIAFISDKYKMRKLFADLLLLLYDLYTTYTFLLILLQTWRYRRDYLTNIKFDNCYITREFVEFDRNRHLSSTPSSVDYQKAVMGTDSETAREGSSKEKRSGSKAVLPLTKDESERYINPFTCFKRTKGERQVRRASCWTFVMFLAIALSVFYLDNIFYSILSSIQAHSLIRYKEIGHHQLDIKVYGSGMMARLVQKLLKNFHSVYKLDRFTSTERCLPQASHTASSFYINFIALMTLYFLIDEFSTYARRLRPLTCSLFYPEREHKRIKYLHRFIGFQRQVLQGTGVKNYLISESGISIKEEEAQKMKEDLDEAEDGQAFSLAEAYAYLRQCCYNASSCLKRK